MAAHPRYGQKNGLIEFEVHPTRFFSNPEGAASLEQVRP